MAISPLRHSPLGRTLVIANPASHSGRGAHDAAFAEHFLGSYAAATNGYAVRFTTAPGDAEHMAAQARAEGFDTVVALGGDGVIHETVNGLMASGPDARSRPQLGIIPVGSGNDYARTLSMPINDAAAAFARLVRGTCRTVEVGHVQTRDGAATGSAAATGAMASGSALNPGSTTGNNASATAAAAGNSAAATGAAAIRGASDGTAPNIPSSTYFMQTLSFGLDAAIALDTTTRRANNTRQRGEVLFITSGIKILSSSRQGFSCHASFDGEPPIALKEIVFAVQVGPTYGGGFRICPQANPSDGALDICYNVALPPLPYVLALFGLARGGWHAGSRALCLRRARRIEIAFDTEPPVQADGEKLRGTRFSISVVPQALRVIS